MTEDLTRLKQARLVRQPGGDQPARAEQVISPWPEPHDAVQRAERWWRIGITAVLFVLLFRQELVRMMYRWAIPDESHGLLIPAFSLYFLYQQREVLNQTTGKGSYWGLVVMLGSLSVYVYSFIVGFGYPRQFMLILFLGGMVLMLGGWPIMRIAWLPIFFLLFSLRLPDSVYFRLTLPMRMIASQAAVMLLNLLPEVNSQATGVIIHGEHLGQGFSLNVAEACSGMRLLMVFVALGVAMAYLEKRPMWHRILLLVSTIPIAIFCNMLRVILTGIVHIYIGPQYAQGMLHTIMGLAMLGVAFSLYGLLAWIMKNLFIEEDTTNNGVLVVESKVGK